MAKTAAKKKDANAANVNAPVRVRISPSRRKLLAKNEKKRKNREARQAKAKSTS